MIYSAILWVWAGQTEPRVAPARPTSDQLLREELENLRRQAEGEGQRVTIALSNATPEQIVKEFQKQVDKSILADYRNMPEDFRIPEFRVVDVKFEEAFSHFLKLAGMEIVDETPEVIRIEFPPRMSLTTYNQDIKELLNIISKVGGISLIYNPESIKGSISLSVINVPWSDLLRQVTKTLKLEIVREKHDLYRIIQKDELREQMEDRTYKLRYLSPPSFITANFTGTRAATGRIPTPPATVEDLKKNFTFLKLVEAMMTKDGDKLIGSLDYDFDRNLLVVKDVKPVLDRVGELVAKMDVEPDMVLLSMKIVNTKNTDILQWGLNWSSAVGSGTLGSSGLGAGVRVTPEAPPPATGLQFLERTTSLFASENRRFASTLLSQYDLNVVLRAVAQDNYSRISQEPQLLIVDNSPGVLFVGTNEPFAVLESVASGVTTATTVKTIDLRTGFTLFVIPRIVKEENKIVITVVPEISQSLGVQTFNFGSLGQVQLPRTADTSLVTRLKLQDGQTAVIGGFAKVEFTNDDTGLPALKDIPLVGWLFSQETQRKVQEHTLIFLTAKIVRGEKENQKRLAEQERLREIETEREIQELRRVWSEGGR